MQSSRLSTGAIAGIAVGGAVAALLALALVLRFFCCRGHGRGVRSAGEDAVPCTPSSAHSSPWEKRGRPKVVAQ